MNNNGTYKVGIYLRLSREDDLSDESKSITHQREIATEYCIQNGFRIVKEYVDDGVSGATDDRPKFQELINDIEIFMDGEDKFDDMTVLVVNNYINKKE